MLPENEMEALTKERIEEYVTAENLNVFLDANEVFTSQGRRRWESQLHKIRISRGVLQEIRRHPDRLGANKFATRCESEGRIVDATSHPWPFCHTLIEACAIHLTPAINDRIVESCQFGTPVELADKRVVVEKQVQGFLNDSNCQEPSDRISSFLSTLLELAGVDPSEIPESVPVTHPSIKKSIHKYHQKRTENIHNGKLEFNDEKVATEATSWAFASEKPSVIFSGDRDMHVIMKQISDNLMQVFAGDEFGEATLYDQNCQNLDSWREQKAIERTIIALEQNDTAVDTPEKEDAHVVLVNPNDNVIAVFDFPRDIITRVTELEKAWDNAKNV